MGAVFDNPHFIASVLENISALSAERALSISDWRTLYESLERADTLPAPKERSMPPNTAPIIAIETTLNINTIKSEKPLHLPISVILLFWDMTQQRTSCPEVINARYVCRRDKLCRLPDQNEMTLFYKVSIPF
jgi:hypothetical protein